MTIEEGLKLLEDAYYEYHSASCIAQKAKGKTLHDYENKMRLIRNKVENIFMTCPHLKSFIDYKDVFFSPVFFESDLFSLIKTIRKKLEE